MVASCLSSFSETAVGILSPPLPVFFPELPKPAPFIIFQQPCSNWAASPPAVTHHPLYVEQEEIQRCLVRHRPVAEHQLLHLNCICGQLSRGIDTELIPETALSFFLCWYLSPARSTVLWKPGNDVAYQSDWRQGYNTLEMEALLQGFLSPDMARTLNILLLWALFLLKFCRASFQKGSSLI